MSLLIIHASHSTSTLSSSQDLRLDFISYPTVDLQWQRKMMMMRMTQVWYWKMKTNPAVAAGMKVQGQVGLAVGATSRRIAAAAVVVVVVIPTCCC
jgi:hypothetical protein